jgi:hypothetical protein
MLNCATTSVNGIQLSGSFIRFLPVKFLLRYWYDLDRADLEELPKNGKFNRF